MTASDPTPAPDAGDRSIAERALDVLVYLPAGAVLAALEDVPETVAKGKARVDQELRNAKVVGRFAVGVGWRQLRDQVEWLTGDAGLGAERESEGLPGEAERRSRGADVHRGERREHARAPKPRAPKPRTAPGTGRPGTAQPGTAPAPSGTPRTAPARAATPARDPEVDRAIPDYDILAASQVVRRLDGLGHEELVAVIRHERATRARRTILHRAEQLLGGATGTARSSGPPGPDRTA